MTGLLTEIIVEGFYSNNLTVPFIKYRLDGANSEIGTNLKEGPKNAAMVSSNLYLFV